MSNANSSMYSVNKNILLKSLCIFFFSVFSVYMQKIGKYNCCHVENFGQNQFL